MVGDGGVGKTSIIDQLVTGSFNDALNPTIGSAYVRHVVHIPSGSVVLSIWDTAGQEKFHSLVPLYMRNAHGIVFTFDISRVESFYSLGSIYDTVQNDMRPTTRTVMCANKIDLAPFETDIGEFQVWAKQRGMELVLTSAKTGIGVAELFARLAADVHDYVIDNKRRDSEDVVKQICESPDDRTRCC
jgi:small GTP-binding protein